MRRRTVLASLAGLGALMTAGYFPLGRHWLAIQLLRAMEAEDRTIPPIPGSRIRDLTTADGRVIPARMYGPPPESARLSIVLGHGIHYKGIDEPRLIRFSRHLADLNVCVLTPELTDLADYRVTATGVEILQRGVLYLSALAKDKVGLIGFSFAGGLALLGARDPAVAARLQYVASIGGYHDLARTLRFLATNRVEGLGGIEQRPAHEYGLLVLLYQHLGELGFHVDEELLHQTLRAWLMEDRPTARKFAAQLTTDKAKHVVTLLEKGRLTELAPDLLPILEREENALRALSPSGTLRNLKMPLIFLHGAGDNVVPPEETFWAEKELSEGDGPSYFALSTPLLEHVRVEHPANLTEQIKLVHLVAQLF